MPSSEAPQQIRLVGALVGLQALAAIGFAIVLLVRAAPQVRDAANDFGEAGYFGLLGIGLVAVAIGLLRGKRWAFAPAVVVQVLLLGVGWYALIGASRFDIGVPLVLITIGGLVLLFARPSRAWRLHEQYGADER